jgi:hypothetical protein
VIKNYSCFHAQLLDKSVLNIWGFTSRPQNCEMYTITR